MTSATLSALDQLDLTDPERWAREGYPHADFKRFRQEAPIYWYDRPGVEPFWSFTKQREIHFISRHPYQFSSEGRRLVIARTDERGEGDYQGAMARPIISTDPPMHGLRRNLIGRLFTPRGIEQYLRPKVERICAEVIDDVIERKTDRATGVGTCDFVLDIAARLPLYLTCELLGVPREDAPRMFDLVNITLGSADPEYSRGKTPQEARREASEEMRAYNVKLLDTQRGRDGDTITSIFLNSSVNGEQLTDAQVLAEMGLVMAGGFETTRNATTGGVLALIEHPDQYDQFLADPEGLMPTMIEETLRWTTPVIHFGRECMEDTEVSGQLIRKGEVVCMWYASGNHDEDVFEGDPDVFDIRRTPNDHVAFGGFGEHYCLGANLARLSLRTMHGTLVDRFERFELAGKPERLRSFFLGGIKHMPVQYRVRA